MLGDWCGATCETPDGTGLVCSLPKDHLPHDEWAHHRGWYEGSACTWSDVCARCEPHMQATPDAPCAMHMRIDALEAERAAMHDALMKAQWAFRHRCNGCDCQRVAAEAVDAVLEAHEVLP